MSSSFNRQHPIVEDLKRECPSPDTHDAMNTHLWRHGTAGKYKYSVKISPLNSEKYGLHQGNIFKLVLRNIDTDVEVALFDREWIKIPENDDEETWKTISDIVDHYWLFESDRMPESKQSTDRDSIWNDTVGDIYCLLDHLPELIQAICTDKDSQVSLGQLRQCRSWLIEAQAVVDFLDSDDIVAHMREIRNKRHEESTQRMSRQAAAEIVDP